MVKLMYAKPKRRRGRGCRVSDRDVAATEAKHFANERSYVRLDGSEVLYGNDWKQRKAELKARSGGQCERWVGKWGSENHDRCRSAAIDPHHIVKRSKRRDDRLGNLEHLCRLHHDLLDERKTRFGEAGAVARHSWEKDF